MLIILFVISILNVLNSAIKNSQNLTLMTRILIDLSFLIIISVIKIIITINNNNSNNHKLLKSNNVRYQKLVDLCKSSAKTQMSLLNKISLVNKTQTLTTMMTTEIRLNLTIMNFNDDFLLMLERLQHCFALVFI